MGEATRGPVAISGASGLIGSALRTSLERDGVEVRPLVRGGKGRGIGWDPDAGTIEREALEGVRAVVHLAGESIAGGRWNEERKARIFDSRARGTALLAEALASLERKPEVLVSASAVGYYGARGDELLTEESGPGQGFLVQVCEAWERAALPAGLAGIRVVHPRIGFVLAPEGGGLEPMRRLFRLGLGGRVGEGRQYVSWVSLVDVVGAIRFALDEPSISGSMNLVAPAPVTNAELTRELAKALRRPAVLPVPSLAVKLILGEMADELILHGQRVVPRKLEQAGYRFRHRTLDEALAYTEGERAPRRGATPARREPHPR